MLRLVREIQQAKVQRAGTREKGADLQVQAVQQWVGTNALV